MNNEYQFKLYRADLGYFACCKALPDALVLCAYNGPSTEIRWQGETIWKQVEDLGRSPTIDADTMLKNYVAVNQNYTDALRRERRG